MTTAAPLPLLRDRGVWAGACTLALAVGLDLLAADVSLVAAYAIGALVASMLTTPLRTLGVAAPGLVLAATVGYLAAGSESAGEWRLRMVACTVLTVLSVVSAYLHAKRADELRRMTAIADSAQAAILKPLPATAGSYRLTARYVSATEDARVGGDFYELVETADGVRLVVGDVCGKGLEAVQVAATVLGAFRQSAFSERDLLSVVRSVDAVASRVMAAEDFATAAFATLDDDGLALVSCGHPPPLLLGWDARPVELVDDPPSPPLGLGVEPRGTRYAVPPGARVLFYTDGLIEARDAHGAFFPLEDHLDDLVTDDLDRALDRLLGSLHDFAGHAGDDIALVLLERVPSAAGVPDARLPLV